MTISEEDIFPQEIGDLISYCYLENTSGEGAAFIGGGSAGTTYFASAETTGATRSNFVYLVSGKNNGSGGSGDVIVKSGSCTSTGDSGDVVLRTGPSTGGTRGTIKFEALVVNLPTAIADPTGTNNGDCYYNTSTNQLRVYNGGTWRGVTLA